MKRITRIRKRVFEPKIFIVRLMESLSIFEIVEGKRQRTARIPQPGGKRVRLSERVCLCFRVECLSFGTAVRAERHEHFEPFSPKEVGGTGPRVDYGRGGHLRSGGRGRRANSLGRSSRGWDPDNR